MGCGNILIVDKAAEEPIKKASENKPAYIDSTHTLDSLAQLDGTNKRRSTLSE